ncbi:ribonuclease R [Spiroplasma endosymbiont of Aspidapion aeneum]|uniref:ribonuclease R n=1 Tax=Spiroplasma endosymbiont of Aspidapion aeneum TaxID=3066276 RepID=UPI00313DE40E
MQHKLFNYIKMNKSIKYETLEEVFKNDKNFNDELEFLINNNKIHQKKDGSFYILGENEKIGVIKIHEKGFGFIHPITDEKTDDDFYVSKIDLANSISADVVSFDILSTGDRSSAKVLKIIDRPKKYLVGYIELNNNFLDFVPNDPLYKNYYTKIDHKNSVSVKKDDIVKVNIVNVENNRLIVIVTDVIGNNNRAIDKIIAIAYEHDIGVGFSQEAIANTTEVVNKYNKDILERESRKKESLSHLDFVTIDGSDSKDLDDAIYVERTENGYKLIVAIADVSYFVSENSHLDKEALKKGNSTYLANKVLPMLPEILSNDLCSLNPNTEKFSLACVINFDTNGNVIAKKVLKTIIISKARLTYSEVNNFFESGKFKHPSNIAEMILLSRELHQKIDKLKFNKGTIEFNIPELKVILNNDGNVIDIIAKESGEAEKLIENFMVSANEAVATLVYEKKYPFIYRNHDVPDEISLLEWYSTLTLLGVNPKVDNQNKGNPKYIVQALRSIDKDIVDKKEKAVINISLLKYMGKAFYGPNNIGHFGLASSCYTHFTSPIRRYSDLIVHRLLKKYFIEKNNEKYSDISVENIIKKQSNIINIAERNSIDAERDVNKVCAIEYLDKHIGEEFDSIISYVAKFGVFVQLENLIEGMIHISNLQGYTYDDTTKSFNCPNARQLKIGQRIKVKLISTNVLKKIIDFQLVK